MAERIQLDENQIESVVGGAYTYFEDSDGNYKCTVDRNGVVIGTYFATYNAKRVISQIIVSNKDKTFEEKLQMAIDAGVLSENPF